MVTLVLREKEGRKEQNRTTTKKKIRKNESHVWFFVVLVVCFLLSPCLVFATQFVNELHVVLSCHTSFLQEVLVISSWIMVFQKPQYLGARCVNATG